MGSIDTIPATEHVGAGGRSKKNATIGLTVFTYMLTLDA